MQNTYWNKAGKYQAEYDRLVNLVPDSGNCDTVAGEMIRAVSRLGYDFYNNGMGNNTSGAVNFLDHMDVFVTREDSATFATIYDMSRGAVYSGRYEGDSLHTAIERAVDLTIEAILANPALETQPNTDDIFDYEDPEQHWCDDCGEECERGYVCRDCELSYEEECEY